MPTASAQESPGGSGNSPQGWELVDGERHLDYELDTRYAEYFKRAVASWNELGGVQIEPSPSPRETDVVVTDGPANGFMAITQSDGDLIYDPSQMDGSTDNAKEAVSAHELGHALGFPHTSRESVMNTPIITNTTNNFAQPTPYDVSLYRDTWGSSGGSGTGSNASNGSGQGSPESPDPGGAGSGFNPDLEDQASTTSGSLPAYCKPFQVIGLIKDVGKKISDLGGGGGSGETKGTGTGKEVVKEAMRYEGTRYVLGGLAECIPFKQMDCTCLTRTVFEKFGYSGPDALPDAPQQLLDYGEPVEGEPEAGDVIVYEDPGDGTGGHAAIATGDGGVFHCASVRLGCLYTPDYHKAGLTPTAGIRRLVDGGGSGKDAGTGSGKDSGGE